MSELENAFDSKNRDDLLRALEMFAKNWLAHDGCWFLAAEESLGMEAAIELDSHAWKRFAAVESRRIMITFNIPEASGLQALGKALSLRLYAVINSQRMEWSRDRSICASLCISAECRRRAGGRVCRTFRARLSA